MTDADLDHFLSLRCHLQIAHHIPGRIRLRVAPSVFRALGSIDSSLLQRLPRSIDGVGEVRVNKAAGSAVISYAVDRLDPGLWERLIHGETGEVLALLKELLQRQGHAELREPDLTEAAGCAR